MLNPGLGIGISLHFIFLVAVILPCPRETFLFLRACLNLNLLFSIPCHVPTASPTIAITPDHTFVTFGDETETVLLVGLI